MPSQATPLTEVQREQLTRELYGLVTNEFEAFIAAYPPLEQPDESFFQRVANHMATAVRAHVETLSEYTSDVNVVTLLSQVLQTDLSIMETLYGMPFPGDVPAVQQIVAPVEPVAGAGQPSQDEPWNDPTLYEQLSRDTPPMPEVPLMNTVWPSRIYCRCPGNRVSAREFHMPRAVRRDRRRWTQSLEEHAQYFLVRVQTGLATDEELGELRERCRILRLKQEWETEYPEPETASLTSMGRRRRRVSSSRTEF